MNTSHPQVIRALLAKDWHLSRMPRLTMIAVGLAFYLCAVIAGVVPGNSLAIWFVTLIASLISLYVLCLIAALFGGMALAEERRDRSCDLLAMLPVTRKQVMLSKCLITVISISSAALIHIFIAIISSYLMHRSGDAPSEMRIQLPFWSLATTWIGITCCLFGFAWAFGTFITSGMAAACLSVLTTTAAVLTVVTAMAHCSICRRMDEDQFGWICFGIVVFMGAAAWISGTIYYNRRIAV